MWNILFISKTGKRLSFQKIHAFQIKQAGVFGRRNLLKEKKEGGFVWKCKKEEAKMLQWHPAFFAEIQIELQEDAEHLIFENEHQLGTKPKEIDVLIIKKDKGRVIRKNIGRIFRQHNIVEYKSPLDYLSIDDFYKVYGYTCFYKSDTSQMDSIPIEELTITLVTGKYPRKLMHHLKTTLRYQVKKAESGIYYVTGDKIPIQIIVTKELTEAENLWLKSLTNELEQNETAEKLLEEYSKNQANALYRSVMELIVRANKQKFEEVKGMCDALRELMKDEIDAEVKKQVQEKINAEVESAVEITKKRKAPKQQKKRINALIIALSKADRMEDIVKAAKDHDYQQNLFKEFGL